LTAALAPISAGPPVLICSPQHAGILRIYGGYGLQGIPILTSAAVGNDVLAVAPEAICSAFAAIPEVSSSIETTLHLSDTPVDIGTPGTPPVVAAPVKSMFQTDSVALKLQLEASWAKRDPRALAWLTPSW
jgi:hypothetical protein